MNRILIATIACSLIGSAVSCAEADNLSLGNLQKPNADASDGNSGSTSCAMAGSGDAGTVALGGGGTGGSTSTGRTGGSSTGGSDSTGGSGGSSTGGSTTTGGSGGSDSTGGSGGSPGAYQVEAAGYVRSGSWSGYAWVATDEASNALPEGFEELDAGQPLCFNGFVLASEDYSGFAGLGINLNQGVDSDTPGSWDVAAAGVHYQLTNSLQSELRLELLGTDGEIWCAALQTDSGSLAWSEFRTECWSNQGDVYDGSTPLQSIMVLVPGQNVSNLAFDLCIDTLEPTNDVPSDPGQPEVCADSTGVGSGALAPGFEVAPGGYVTTADIHGWAFLSATTDSGHGTSITPSDFAAHPGTAPLCASGVLGASPDYTDVALLGMNLNQAGDAEADVGLWSPSGDGIAYDISNCAGSFLRLELNGADGEFDANSRWCASISGEQGFIPWTDFNTECWSNEGDFYDGATPLRSAMVLVPSDAADEIPFDFCLNGLTIADNPE